MKILESKQSVFRIKQLVQYSNGAYAVRFISLKKDLKTTKKTSVKTFKSFGEAFNRYNDCNYSYLKCYTLINLQGVSRSGETKASLRAFLRQHGWTKNCIDCLFNTGKCYGWTFLDESILKVSVV
jgi:hypothetical protein